MGNQSVKEFTESLPNEVFSTPRNYRSVNPQFDPRSPSLEIQRTPIEVQKTPELVSDPRSPCASFSRTPIFEIHKSRSNPELNRFVT